MCRALKVLCVAEGEEALRSLKRAVVSAEWELLPGASGEAQGLRQLREERPHVVVAFGDLARFVAAARREFPALRIVTDRDCPGTSVVVGSASDVKRAALGRTG